MTDLAITDLLASLGLEGSNADQARSVLEQAGLTNQRKQRISVVKLPAVRAAIDASIARLCARCAANVAGDGRMLVRVETAQCARCNGSATRRALDELAAACRSTGLGRVVVVGGSPDVRRELAAVGDSVEIRLVDGTERRTKAQALRDVDWADVVVIAGASELAHKVSLLYTREPGARGKLVTSSRRGVEAIATAIGEHLRRR